MLTEHLAILIAFPVKDSPAPSASMSMILSDSRSATLTVKAIFLGAISNNQYQVRHRY
jgi:hypothetical protein